MELLCGAAEVDERTEIPEVATEGGPAPWPRGPNLTQAICTFRQGRLVDRSHEAQQYRASGLNLVIAAIVYWNSTYMADAVEHLRAAGEMVPDALLAHTSPVGWEHVAFSGDFLWDRAAQLSGRRPLNIAERWEVA